MSRLPALVAILALACSQAATSPPEVIRGTEVPESCRQQTTLRLGDSDVVVTLDDARAIRAAVEKYLIEKKPKLEDEVYWPPDPFIDCEGVVRMGAWVLAPTSDGELRLAFRVVKSELMMVTREITIQRAGEKWKAVSTGRVLWHLRP